MKLYFAGIEQKHHLGKFKEAGAQSGLAVIWELFKKDLSFLVNEVDDVFIDSGAFSAHSRGIKIDIDKYCAIIKKYNIKLYAGLDVIGDPVKTKENQWYMEMQGLNPIPTFHFGSDLNELRILKDKYPYIALGGLVPYAKEKPTLMAWLDKCFKVIKLDCKVHGFGMTGIDILLRYPFYSVDSTSWLSGEKRGEVLMFNRGKIYPVEFRNKNKVFEHGLDPAIFLDDKEKNYRNRSVENIRQYMKVEKYVTDIWKLRGIEWN